MIITDHATVAAAQRIIRIAMGRDKHGKWNYDLDPLAAWCGVEAILAITHEQPAPAGKP